MKKGTSLRIGGEAIDGLVYVGKSEQLPLREYGSHFKTGGTGFSTLRRSFDALLHDHLSLAAIPRGRGRSRADFTNYRFDEQSENKLSKWMIGGLEIGVCAVDDDLDQTESHLIKSLRPALCLKGWRNPMAKVMRAARKLCADEARSKA